MPDTEDGVGCHGGMDCPRCGGPVPAEVVAADGLPDVCAKCMSGLIAHSVDAAVEATRSAARTFVESLDVTIDNE